MSFQGVSPRAKGSVPRHVGIQGLHQTLPVHITVHLCAELVWLVPMGLQGPEGLWGVSESRHLGEPVGSEDISSLWDEMNL